MYFANFRTIFDILHFTNLHSLMSNVHIGALKIAIESMVLGLSFNQTSGLLSGMVHSPAIVNITFLASDDTGKNVDWKESLIINVNKSILHAE